MTSMSYQYLLGLTVNNIISKTCDVSWSVLPYPYTKEKWLRISKEFKERDLNHCIGAIDGKHVIIQVSC